MYLKYHFLACGPRVKCNLCKELEWSEVKQSQDEGLGWVPYSWRQSEPIPASWSLHCGGACSKKTLTTSIFEKLENPFFRNLTQKNRSQYEYNRKRVATWILAGWPETSERIKNNKLLYVAKGSLKEYAQLWLEVFGKDPTMIGEKDEPTHEQVTAVHSKHLAYLKRQFPELLHVRDPTT